MIRKLHRQALFFTLTTIILVPRHSKGQSIDSIQAVMNNILFQEAVNLRYEQPDSSMQIFDLCYSNYMAQEDTMGAIQSLIQLALLNGHRANYKSSYDKLWKALLLAEGDRYLGIKISIYNDLGRYYSFYKRTDEAFHYLGLARKIKELLIENGELPPASLATHYYAMCATYRELNEPELARTYLDSAFQIHTPDASAPNIAFLKFEEAFLLKEDGKFSEALRIYQEIQPWISKYAPTYQVLLLTYMGDVFRQIKDFRRGEAHYQKALAISEQYHSHIDFTPLIHEKLADLYQIQGNLSAAFASLQTAKELDLKFFDSRSETNRPLLEIQDAFREEQERVEQLLQEQRIKELEQKNKIWFLERTIFIVSLLFLILIGFIYVKHVRSKHRDEKRLLEKERGLEKQKTDELLELKNKELAASTLKLIERDEFLASLRGKLAEHKNGLSPAGVDKIVRSIGVSTRQNWEEFEARFIAVNKDFYKRLRERFPKLTQGDQKLCALIKLNFSSKDMAKLIGISVDSVHTTRYRLRKKLNLPRDVSLGEFIGQL